MTGGEGVQGIILPISKFLYKKFISIWDTFVLGDMVKEAPYIGDAVLAKKLALKINDLKGGVLAKSDSDPYVHGTIPEVSACDCAGWVWIKEEGVYVERKIKFCKNGRVCLDGAD